MPWALPGHAVVARYRWLFRRNARDIRGTGMTIFSREESIIFLYFDLNNECRQ